METEKATLRDAEEISEIEWESRYKWNKNRSDCRSIITKMFNDKNCKVYFLKDNGKNVGYLSVNFDKKKRICYVNYFAVRKKYQGRGYGEILKRKQIMFAKRNKMRAIETSVWEKNHRMIKLNKKYGFYIIRVKKKHYPNGDNKLFMRKELK